MKRFLKGISLCVLIIFGAYLVGSLTLSRWASVDDFFKAGVFGATYRLFLSVLALLAIYQIGRLVGKACEESLNYVFLMILGLAIVFALTLPRNSGVSYVDCDPLRGGGCDVIVDEEEHPLSKDEKLREAILIFFGITIPGIIGARKGFNEAKEPQVSIETSSPDDSHT